MATRRMAAITAAVMAAVALQADATATTIHFVNRCEDALTWYDGHNSRALATGAVWTAQLAVGDNAAYRAGVTNDATLAEFAVDASNTWFDISIIPTGPLGGPGSCGSLQECKEVTGGNGFNVAMRIVPSQAEDAAASVCRTLSCLEDGCDDAYQYPDQDAKTHNCGAGVSFEVIFCPLNEPASSSPSSGLGSSSSSSSNNTKWVPLESSSSDAAPQAAEAAASAASVASEAETKSSSRSGTSSSSGNEQQTGNYISGNEPDSSSAAVTVAIVLAASVAVIVIGTVIARHWRTVALRWEAAHWRKPRSSSPTLSFVELEGSP